MERKKPRPSPLRDPRLNLFLAGFSGKSLRLTHGLTPGARLNLKGFKGKIASGNIFVATNEFLVWVGNVDYCIKDASLHTTNPRHRQVSHRLILASLRV